MSNFGNIVFKAIASTLPCVGCGLVGEKSVKCHYCRKIFCTEVCCKKHAHSCSEYPKKKNNLHKCRSTENPHKCEANLCSKKAAFFCESCKKYLCYKCQDYQCVTDSHKSEKLENVKNKIANIEKASSRIKMYESEKDKIITKQQYMRALEYISEIRKKHVSSTIYLQKLKDEEKSLQ
jgi:hypothetical protein